MKVLLVLLELTLILMRPFSFLCVVRFLGDRVNL